MPCRVFFVVCLLLGTALLLALFTGFLGVRYPSSGGALDASLVGVGMGVSGFEIRDGVTLFVGLVAAGRVAPGLVVVG